MFLSHQMNEQSINTGALRSQSVYIQKLLISTLNYRIPSGSYYENASTASLIGMNYCGKYTKGEVNETVNYVISKLNKPNNYFIFTACPNGNCDKNPIAICSDDVTEKFGSCCVKTEKITIATFNMSLPEGCNYNYVIISLGIWPKTMEVESCD